MAEATWFVRDRGQIRGPYSLDQLLQLHRRGQLARFHDVSEDRRNWSKAAALLDQLNPGVALDPASESPRRSPPPSTVPDPSSEMTWPAATDDALVGDRPRSKPSSSKLKWAAILAVPIVLSAFAMTILMYLLLNGGKPSIPFAAFSPSIHSTKGNQDEIAAAVGLVVVGVEYTRPDGTHGEMPLSTGSCFAITDDGWLLTNRHVVQFFDQMNQATGIENRRPLYVNTMLADVPPEKRAELMNSHPKLKFTAIEPRIWVFFIGKNKRPEKKVAVLKHLCDETEPDLAILKVDRSKSEPRKGPYFRLASSDENMARGEVVVALGFPGTSRHAVSLDELQEERMRALQASRVESMFKQRDFSYSRNAGEVSNKDSERNGHRWIQHNAAITHGNSGGPLVNLDGLVVGINTRGEQDGSTYWALSIASIRDRIEDHVKRAEFSEE